VYADRLEVAGGSTGFLATLRWLYGSTAVRFSYGITGPTTLPGLAGIFFSESKIILGCWLLKNEQEILIWEKLSPVGIL